MPSLPLERLPTTYCFPFSITYCQLITFMDPFDALVLRHASVKTPKTSRKSRFEARKKTAPILVCLLPAPPAPAALLAQARPKRGALSQLRPCAALLSSKRHHGAIFGVCWRRSFSLQWLAYICHQYFIIFGVWLRDFSGGVGVEAAT